MEKFRLILDAGFIICCITCGMTSVYALYCLACIPFYAREFPENKLIKWNPVNIVFHREFLTERGLHIRRNLVISMCIFLAFWVLAWMIVITAKAFL